MQRLLAVWSLLAGALSVTVSYNDIPKLNPLYPNVSYTSSYTLSTFLPLALTTQSYFLLNFSSSNIAPPTGSLNCTYFNQSTQATVHFSNCSCSNNVCTLAPQATFTQAYNLLITFGNITNPSFVSDQTVNITVVVSPNSVAYVNSTISSLVFSANAMSLNAFTQSNYGVGSTNVTYTFNFSVGRFIPSQPMIQLVYPKEVALSATGFSLVFYGQAIFNNPTQVSGSLIFYINAAAVNNANGFVLLTVSGFVNPQYIGQSSSFQISFNTMLCVSGCLVSYINNGILASSNTAGYLPVNTLYSNNTVVNSQATLIANLQLYAPIPVGGMLQILLPPNIRPFLPISCQSINGYTLTDSNNATCYYNSTTNVISTVNFAYPYLAAPSTAAMSFVVINPSDTTPSVIKFQTIDSNGRTIGVSQAGYLYSATPGALNCTIVRNDTELDHSVTLSVNLSFKNNIPANGKIQLLIPTDMVNVSGSLVCKSGLATFTCYSGVAQNNPKVLNVTFTPSCSPNCVTMSFSLSSLKNPSYLNPDSDPIIVQSLNADFTGMIDSNQIDLSSLPLNVHIKDIKNLIVVGSGVVGTPQQLTIVFPLNSYFQSFGGLISVSFPANSTFSSSSLSSFSLVNNTSLAIPLTSTLYDSNMGSLSGVTFSINCTALQCGSTISITLSGITYSYSSLSYSPYNFTIATELGYLITQGNLNYTALAPITSSFGVFIDSTIKITGYTTSYNLTLIPTIPIDSLPNGGYIQLAVPSSISLSGSTCSIITNVSLGFTLSCQIINSSVQIYYIVGTPATLKYTAISLILSGVVNPLTLTPLNYTLTSFFNYAPSQIFTSNYSLTSPAAGSLTVTKSNNTYGITATLVLSNEFQFPLTVTDTVILQIPSGMLTFTSNTLLVGSQSTNVSIVNSGSQQTITLMPGISSSLLSLTLSIINPSSTQSFGNITLTVNRGGFASQSATATIPPCDPLTLNVSGSTTSYQTGDTVNLTISFLANPNSKFLKISLPNSAWGYSNAFLLGSPLTNNSVLTISSLSNSLVFRNLLNRVALSPLTEQMILTLLDSSYSPVEMTSLPATLFAANIAKSIQSSGYRSNSISSSPINLTLGIQGVIQQSNLSTISVYLPQYQFIISSNVTCVFSNISIGCNLLGSSNNTIIINYPCDSLSCSVLSFNVVVGGIYNLYSDQTPINITVLNNGYVSQQSQSVVTPPISSSQLKNVNIALSNKTISTNNTVTVSFESELVITSASSISLVIDDLVFLRGSDCVYLIGAANYTGCSFNVSTAGYITWVTLNTLGQNSIQPNTTISITVKFINTYAASNVGSSIFKVVISYNNILVSAYSTTMAVLLNNTTFTPVAFSSLSVQRNTSKAGGPVSFFFQAGIPVAFSVASTFLVTLPKNLVSVPSNHTLGCTNCTATFSSEDSASWSYSVAHSGCQSLSCPSQTLLFALNGLTNSNFSYVVVGTINVQLTLASSVVCSSISLNLSPVVPLEANISASRSNPNAFQSANITLQISIPNPLPANTLIDITPLSQIFYGGFTNIWLAGGNGSASFANTFQGDILSNCVVNVTSTLNQFILILQSINSPLSPIQGSLLNISIYSSSILYYQNNLVRIQNEIIPYTSNLTLTNSNPLAGEAYYLQIQGFFQILDLSGYVLNINTTQGNCTSCAKLLGNTSFPLTTNNISLSIANLTNPMDTVPIVYSVTISSQAYIAYNNQIEVLPKVIANTFSSNYNLSSQTVSTTGNLSLQLTSSAATTINVTLPRTLISTVNKCYLNGEIVSGWGTVNSTKLVIQISNVSLINGGVLTLEVVTSPYSLQINDSINISIKYPVSVASVPVSLILAPSPLKAKFFSTSLTASTIATYTLSLGLLNVSESTYVLIDIPFVCAEISSTSTPVLSVTSNILTLSSFSLLEVITFSQVANPDDNRTMTVRVRQVSNATKLTIGETKVQYSMNRLAPITLTQATRDNSHYNMIAEITLTTNTKVNGSTLNIQLPDAQVTLTNSLTCYTNILGVVSAIPCSYNGVAIKVSRPSGWVGENTLVINGFSNVNFSRVLSGEGSIKIDLLTPDGYTCASLYDVVFLSPNSSSGVILINNLSISSLDKFTPITLSFNFSLQDSLAPNSLLVIESNMSFVQTAALKCLVSNTPFSCVFSVNKTTITLVNQTGITSGTVLIIGLSVGAQANPLQIYTFDSANHGYIDTYSSKNPFIYNVLPLKMRVIFPIHTVGTHNFSILIDNNLPSLIDNIYCLDIAVSSSQSTNSLVSIDDSPHPFSSTICLNSSLFRSIDFVNIKFSSVTTSQMEISLRTGNIQIASGQQSIDILQVEHGFCDNPDCDSCSSSPQGEHCFSCREGMVSFKGHCQQECPSSWFSHEGVCQQCSYNCGTCFGQASNQCLSCVAPLIDDSGTCVTECLNGHIENGFCMSNDKCTSGCDSCSPSGFCYTCSKNYQGIGVCTYKKSLPETFFTYFSAAPAIGYAVLIFFDLVKCNGLTSLAGSSIMSLAVLELFCNVMLIPLSGTLCLTSWLTIIIVFKVVTAIAIYESHFKTLINKQEELIEKPLTRKDKFIMFMAHLIGVDAYQFYFSKVGEPTFKPQHFGKPVRLFKLINLGPRAALFCTCIYLLTSGGVGDWVILPVVCMVSQVLITLSYLVFSPRVMSTLDRCLSCMKQQPT